MNGIHDLGGMHGFGPVVVEPDEPVFHGAWEGRVLGMVYQMVGFGWANIDAFRHAIERLNPVDYLTAGYYGRWLASLETLLVERGLLARGDVDARLCGEAIAPTARPSDLPRPASGFERTVEEAPRFAVGQPVRARNLNPGGHTRLARYLRGKRGVVNRVHGAFVFPDTNAHGRGEHPQHLYSVRFAADELWGADAEASSSVHVDLFEDYLESI